jgi:putative membrane protein
MKRILSQSDKDHLNQLVAEAEKLTDAQIVLAVVKRSDSYAELPWKAFAIGTSVAGLLLFVLHAAIPSWYSPTCVLIALAATLATGISLALLTVFVPPFARLFLSSHRAETEVKQHAESIFISHEVFATLKRTGILLFVSLFERKVFILPDKGMCSRLGQDETGKIMKPMLALLRHHELRKAFEEGLNGLTEILQSSSRQVPDDHGENELPNEIIEEEGV